jgi:hypothetical protein
VTTAFQQQPCLMLLLLRDEADPGFPSFPVLRVREHLALFGQLLPDCFINQGEQRELLRFTTRLRGCPMHF